LEFVILYTKLQGRAIHNGLSSAILASDSNVSPSTGLMQDNMTNRFH